MGSLISSRQEYPNLLQWGIGFRLRGVDLFRTFHFHKQAGIQGNVLTYITITDAMVNDRVDGFKSLFIAEMVVMHSFAVDYKQEH